MEYPQQKGTVIDQDRLKPERLNAGKVYGIFRKKAAADVLGRMTDCRMWYNINILNSIRT